MMPKCAIEPNQIPVYCDVYNCSNRAEYTIGNPQGPKSQKMNVCESCMQGIADSIPEEFLPSREDPEPVTAEKLYTCDYCGQVVGTTSTAKASHVRLCPENPKNKGKTKAGGGK